MHEKNLLIKNISFCFTLAVLFSSSLQAAKYQTPHNEFGQPDLQGVWTNATMTPLERPKRLGNQLVISPEAAKKIEDNNPFEKMRERDAKPTDPNAPAPEAGGSGVGGYNVFWMDPGTKIAKINGEYRTSIISSPADGQVPYTKQSREKLEAGILLRRSEDGFDGPEVRALGERCLVGFGSTGGPPMLPVLYNNHYQIVQGPDTITILVEMNHDARVIRLKDKHHPENMKKWMGDSIGHWEGDTLVVNTKGLHPDQEVRIGTQGGVFVSTAANITERFTRTGENEIVYQFTIDDKQAYTSSWTGEMPMYRANEKIFEYACHEGNYAMPGILAGARKLESEGKKVGRP